MELREQCLSATELRAVCALPEMGDTAQCYSSRPMKTFNERFSAVSMRRRYEVWFLRLGLSDASGAWWFRYLLMNPGEAGAPAIRWDRQCKCGRRGFRERGRRRRG